MCGMAFDRTPHTTITEQEAAPYIGLSQAWLRVARREGRGPAYLRIGRAIRYRTEDLDAYMSAHRVEPRERRSEYAGASV